MVVWISSVVQYVSFFVGTTCFNNILIHLMSFYIFIHFWGGSYTEAIAYFLTCFILCGMSWTFGVNWFIIMDKKGLKVLCSQLYEDLQGREWVCWYAPVICRLVWSFGIKCFNTILSISYPRVLRYSHHNGYEKLVRTYWATWGGWLILKWNGLSDILGCMKVIYLFILQRNNEFIALKYWVKRRMRTPSKKHMTLYIESDKKDR